MAKSKSNGKSNGSFTVNYAFEKETPGTYRYKAEKEEGDRLPVGSDVIYVMKEHVKAKPKKIVGVFTVS